MQQYIARRLLLVFLTIVLLSIAVFAIIRLIPGSVIDIMVEYNAYADTKEEMKRLLGLDQPIYLQYVKWMGGVLKGDFGVSFFTGRSALGDIGKMFPVTLEMTVFSMVIMVAVAIPIGILSAIRQDTLMDYLFRSLAILALSVPYFWVATLVIVLPTLWFNWTPPLIYTPFLEDPLGNLNEFIIPCAILGISRAGVLMRMTRAMMLEVLRQDYIRTAWAKGLRERVVIGRHTLKNALIPIVTLIGLQVPVLLGGTVIMENIFNLPGLGRFILDSINYRDYQLLQLAVLLFAVGVVFSNLFVDIAYAWLDPRIRYQ